jgi:hypothetical protein
MIETKGNWTDYRARFNLSNEDEIDLHFGRRDRWEKTYDEAMSDVLTIVEEALREAQTKGRPYIMFCHGRSTSRNGKTTARSMVRGFMRSPAATPFIERSGCIQHETVFVAKIRVRRIIARPTQ